MDSDSAVVTKPSRSWIGKLALVLIPLLIVAIILYAVGTGPVKGFAVTLSIGILTSMFTAIVGSRAIVNRIYGGKNISTLSI